MLYEVITLDGANPFGMSADEWIVAQRVLRALDVALGERMCGVLKAEVDNVLRGDTEETRSRYAEETTDVGRIARTDLERAVDVGKTIRIAIDETINRQVLLVGQEADKSAGRARRHAAHLDKDAARGFPEAVIVEALEHATGLDRQDELGLGSEAQVLDRVGDRVGARAEAGAVDLDPVAGLRVTVDDDQVTSYNFV